MRFLITGARGFIGAATVQAALDAGHSVAVLVRPGALRGRLQGVAGRVTWIEADLSQLDAPVLRRDCAAYAPDTVIHAGWTGVAGADRNREWQVSRNVPVALEVALLASECGAGHFIGIGSQAEYGQCAGRIVESQALHPTTLYGAAKVAAAVVTRTAAALRGMQHSWLRVFSTYGVGADQAWVLPMAADAMVRGAVPALTPCEQRWEFLHVSDAARAICAVAERTAGGIFNLGSGDAQVLRDVILGLRDRIDASIEPNFGAVPYRPDQIMWLEADTARLRDATGWFPSVGIGAGLDELVAEAIVRHREYAHV